MHKLRWITAIITLPFLGFIAIQLLKIPIPDEKDCLVASGIVTAIYEAGEKDIVFELGEQKQSFYINRGLESGLTLHELQHDLLHKQILIKYPKHFTGAHHISKLESAGKTIYTELKK